MKWFFIPLASLTVSCSLFQSEPEKKEAFRPQVENVSYQARATQDLKKRVLVLPFLDEKLQRSQSATEAARSSVVSELLRTGQFVVVKNSDMPQDLGKFLNENREYNLEAISPIASSMGIAAVVEGKILEINARRMGDPIGVFRKIEARVESSVRLRVASTRINRVILDEVRKGEVVAETTRVAEYSFSDRYLQEDPALVQQAVRKAFQGALLPLVQSLEKVSWEGRVAQVRGERVYVNAGRLSGLQMGDILKVSEEGEEIFDPETGIFIGRAPGRMKGTLEVVSYFGTDGSITTIHSGGGFQDNDLVEIY